MPKYARTKVMPYFNKVYLAKRSLATKKSSGMAKAAAAEEVNAM